MRKFALALCLVANLMLSGQTGWAQGTKVAIGISGALGFGPLVIARDTGIFASNGLDVELERMPEPERDLGLTSGRLQCAGAPAHTWLIWAANGLNATQVLLLDKSYGADGLVVRKGIDAIPDLKGKAIAVSGADTILYFLLGWILQKNGLSIQDVELVTMPPGPAAKSFLAGQYDAAMTYEPYLSDVRTKPLAGKVLATTINYPVIMDTLGCTRKFVDENENAVRALAASYFQALDIIGADKQKAYEILTENAEQSSDEIDNASMFLRWQGREANKRFFAGEFLGFAKEAAELLRSLGIVREVPNLARISNQNFVQ